MSALDCIYVIYSDKTGFFSQSERMLDCIYVRGGGWGGAGEGEGCQGGAAAPPDLANQYRLNKTINKKITNDSFMH
jgi:hypothetical protein